MSNKVDLLGSKCGRLKVIRENPVRANDGKVKWDCVCDCGMDALGMRGKFCDCSILCCI